MNCIAALPLGCCAVIARNGRGASLLMLEPCGDFGTDLYQRNALGGVRAAPYAPAARR